MCGRWFASILALAGYQWRLCRSYGANGGVTEECFQRTPLQFHNPKLSYIMYNNGSKVPIPSVTVTEGVSPAGSQWKINPIPACRMCDPLDACGELLPPVPDLVPIQISNATCWYGCVTRNADALAKANCPPHNNQVPKSCFEELLDVCLECFDKNQTAWERQVVCQYGCSGALNALLYGAAQHGTGCPAGTAQFREPLPGLSGESVYPLWDWSVVDQVDVPADIQPGSYVLSWRWDCEVRNSCALLCYLDLL